MHHEEKIISTPLCNLYFKIKFIEDYGETLSHIDPSKGNNVVTLADNLEKKVDIFNKQVLAKEPTKQDIKQFQNEFKELLHSQDEIMSEHRALWKPIIANIAFSVLTAGIGLFAIGIKAGINAYTSYQQDEKLTINNVLFFAKTRGEQQVTHIEKEVKFDKNVRFL
jgi:hypothetical protein